MKLNEIETLYMSWEVFIQKQEEYQVLFSIPCELIETDEDYLNFCEYEDLMRDYDRIAYEEGELDWHTVYIPV